MAQPPRWGEQMKGPSLRLVCINLLVLLLLLSPVALPWLLAQWSLGNPRGAAKLPLLGPAALFLARWPYLNIYRQGIQGRKDCFQRDTTLTYLGKPNGRCQFDSLEFSTTVQMNSFGVRDTQAALLKPRTLVIGDSHAMGWGVEAEQRFSQLLPQPSLNLGVASYGTARELRLLQRYANQYAEAYRGVETIVLQYCANDYGENQATGAKRFQSTSYKNYSANSPYINPKQLIDASNPLHLRLFTENWLMQLLDKNYDPFDLPKGAHGGALLNSFKPYQKLLDGKKLVIFVSTDYGEYNSRVSADLQGVLSKLQQLLKGSTVLLMDSSKACNRDCYYLLDDHLTVAGHQRIGEGLVQIITNQRRETHSGRKGN
jgi:hypothetical protein